MPRPCPEVSWDRKWLKFPELLDITGWSAIAGRPRAVRVTPVGILLQVFLHRPPLAFHELLDDPLGHIVIIRRLERLETAQVALAGVLERRDRQLGQVALVPQRQAAAPAVGRLGSACRRSAGARGASGDGPLEPLASTRVLSDVGALDMSRPSLALPSAVGPPDAGMVSAMTSRERQLSRARSARVGGDAGSAGRSRESGRR